MKHALFALLIAVLAGCSTANVPSDLANKAALGEQGDKHTVAAGFGAVATTRATARLFDKNPDTGGGGEIVEPVVLWNPETKSWQPVFGADGQPLFKTVKGLRDYNNNIGATLTYTVSAAGSGTTSGEQTQGGSQTGAATPTNTVEVPVTVPAEALGTGQ
jgi:hypothetical protein